MHSIDRSSLLTRCRVDFLVILGRISRRIRLISSLFRPVFFAAGMMYSDILGMSLCFESARTWMRLGKIVLLYDGLWAATFPSVARAPSLTMTLPVFAR